MNSDFPHFAAFLGFAVFSFYGGAFLYSLLHYRLIKKCSWGISIGAAFLWMILYAFVSTIIADIGAAGLKHHPYIATGIMIIIVLVPYIATARLLIKYRRELNKTAHPTTPRRLFR